MPPIASLHENAVLPAVPHSERNSATPHEEEEEPVAVTGGYFERCVLNAADAARGVSSASRTIAKKRRSRKAVACNNIPCGLKGTPHDGLCTHMVVFGKRGGRHPRDPTAARRAPAHPAKRAAVRVDLNDTSSEDEPDGPLHRMVAAAAAAETLASPAAGFA
jgi:hypothetical protein